MSAVHDSASSRSSSGDTVGWTPQYALHNLRRSYATHLLQSGTQIRVIQEIQGHKGPKTTMIYTGVTMHDLRSIKSPFADMDL